MLSQTTKKYLKTLFNYAVTVISCVVIIVLGIAFLSRATTVTTTIGENISTNDLIVYGNATTTGSHYIGNNLTVNGNFTVNGAQTLSGAITIPYFNATSTAQASTIAYRLGIGTSSPYATLSVAGIGAFDDYVRASYFTATSTAATSTFPYLTSTQTAITGLTAGSIPFIGAGGIVSQNNANLYWDNTNTRLGISTSTPWAKLSVTNSGTGPSFIVEDAASPDASPFIIDGSGNVGIGTSSPNSALDVVGAISATLSSKDAQYTVFKSGSTIYAMDSQGNIDFSGTNPVTVMESAMGNLTAGRTWKEKIVVIGDYEVTSIIDIPSYTIFELKGRIKPADDGFVGVAIMRNSDITNGNTDIELIGGTIDGNKANLDTGVNFNNCIHIEGSSSSLEAKRIVIRDWDIANCKSEGIETRFASDFIFTRNKISGNGDDGFSILQDSHDGVISDNIIQDNTSATGSSSGIEIEDGSYQISVVGNLVHGEGVGSNMSGIKMVVDSGSIYNAPHDVTITGNVVRNVQGIALSAISNKTTATMYNVIFTGNVVKNTGDSGISIGGNSTIKIKRAVVQGNTVENAGNAASEVGIYAGYGENIIVSENVVTESADSGIRVYLVSEANFINNHLKNNGNSTAAYAIYVTGTNSSSIHIRGNFIHDDQGTPTQNGVGVNAATSKIIIEENNFGTVASTYVVLESSSSATVKNNLGYGLLEGTVCTSIATVSNAGTSEETLMSCSLGANSLIKNGDSLEFVATYTFAVNANNKRVRISLNDGSVRYIYDSTSLAENGNELIIKGTIVRTNTVTQRTTIDTAGSTTVMDADFGDYVAANNTWVNSTTLEFKATGAAASDVSLTLMAVKFIAAP